MSLKFGLALAFALLNLSLISAQTVPPAIDLQAVSTRDKVERNEVANIYLAVANKSNLPLSISAIDVAGDAFDVVLPSLPIELSPYGGAKSKVAVTARQGAKFGPNKLMVTVDVKWHNAGKEFTSKATTTISLEISRRFEDEAKGFPGGTAAFLYLLLPIIPAFLSYQTVERLRTGMSLQMPIFKAEYIVPAFFAAIVVSFLMLIIARSETAVDYSNPRTFVIVMVGSLIIGGLIPGLHWLWNIIEKYKWGFLTADTMQSYLRKALLSPRSPVEFRWVKGNVNNETWEGILLQQPNTTMVLGASLQASPKADTNQEAYQNAVDSIAAEVLDRNGDVKNRARLVAMVDAGEITLAYLNKIKAGSRTVDAVVAVAQINNLEIEGEAEIVPLVKLVG